MSKLIGILDILFQTRVKMYSLSTTQLELTIAVFLNDDGVQTVRIDPRPVHARHGHHGLVSRIDDVDFFATVSIIPRDCT